MMATAVNSSTPREVLNQKLVDLLGFEDGSSDVLDHLLTIESNEDLQNYLSQLLGTSRNEQISHFVQDVGRFRRGEELTVCEDDDDDEKRAAETKNERSVTDLTLLSKKKAAANNTSGKQNVAPKTKPTTKNVARRPFDSSKNNAAPPAPASKKAAKKEVKMTDSTIKSTTTSDKPPPKNKQSQAPPPKGKAPLECGCFGTMHQPLTNCLYCGRIACEREGYNFCPFCGYLMEEVTAPKGKAADKAWMHKERLLRYDREFARRTVILDDQADYFSNETSAWLTVEEQAEAADNASERQKDIHERKKMQLDLAL